MKLIRYGESGRERPGLQLADDTRIDASAFGEDYDEHFFASAGLARLCAWSRSEGHRAPEISPDTRLGPPIARPSKLVCIGMNFRDHAKEGGHQIPDEPVIFLKSTTAISGANDPVQIPRNSKKLDWEVELAAPAILIRRGWTRSAVKIGEGITVVGALAKDGSNLINATSVTLSDGTKVFSP